VTLLHVPGAERGPKDHPSLDRVQRQRAPGSTFGSTSAGCPPREWKPRSPSSPGGRRRRSSLRRRQR
jgi:hypothetical protein